MDRVADKAVKERGILFRAEMVRAILDGRKTQTRRVPGPAHGWRFHGSIADAQREAIEAFCPYGKPGEQLWVKEAHYRYGHWVKNGISKSGRQKWKFKALDKRVIFPASQACPSQHRLKRVEIGWRLRPAIFMPRWASRITLQILKVRVERVQEISEADAIAEGIDTANLTNAVIDPKNFVRQLVAVDRYARLWDAMRAGTEFAWDKNPWVWVIEFRRIS